MGTVLLIPGLGGVRDATFAIISHEQAQSNSIKPSLLNFQRISFQITCTCTSKCVCFEHSIFSKILVLRKILISIFDISFYRPTVLSPE